MIKKKVFMFFLLIFLFFGSFVLAEDNASANLTGFEKSYSCLKTKIDSTGYSSMSIEELGFSLLALAYDRDRQNTIKEELEKKADVSISGQKCWPSGSCTLKETSIILLAYHHINAETSDIKNWFFNQTTVTSDLIWYLQIETENKSECSLTYDNITKKITVNEDKTLSGSPGACFKLAQNNYWLEIVPSCYNKNIEISCNNDFLTAKIYRGKNQNIYYVSDITNNAGPGGKITEEIQSSCFKQGGACNYEGSLWAVLATNKISSKNTKIYLPYLMTFASSNTRSMPYAFLYSLTGFDEYFSELSSAQTTHGYWQASSDSLKRYYDTAVALMSLYGRDTDQAKSAISYLLTPTIHQDGCWQNSLRDTAFLLYAISPRPAATGGTGTSTLVEKTNCKDISNYSCVSATECEKMGGNILENFFCFGGAICCDKKTEELPSCSDLGGKICTLTEDCTGTLTHARGTSMCCIDGSCKEKTSGVNECKNAKYQYQCRDSCFDNEVEITTLTCPEGGSCCAPAPTQETQEETSRSYWWLWLLVFLIMLTILAIIFRDQLKIWWFKIKGKVSKTPASVQQRAMPTTMPPTMQSMGQRRIIPGPRISGPRPLIPPTRPFPKDAELKSTIDRLKELSK